MPDMARSTLPTDECAFCAEKHLATAYALAQERGYEGVTRQRIVGELCLAQWHCWHMDMALAETIRAARHLIQQRREAEVEWSPVLEKMDVLANKELERNT